MTSITDNTVARRLAELAFELAEGRSESTIAILKAQGKLVEVGKEVLTVTSPNFKCGLMLFDGPVDQLNSLMFAIFGPLGFTAARNEFDEATKHVAKRLTERRTARDAEHPPE